MRSKVSYLLVAILGGSIALGAMAHSGPQGQGPNGQSGMGPGSSMHNGAMMGQGHYGDYQRMQRLMEQMHRTDDMDSHYQLMQQHWREMDRMMEQLRNDPAQNATPERLQQRDRAIEELQEQMRLYHQEFDRMPYGHQGGMR